MDFLLDAALMGISTNYARWLKAHKGLEPGRTWLEVTFGVGYVWAVTAAYNRWIEPPADSTAADLRMLRSFIIASIPIIVGEEKQRMGAAAKVAAYRAQRARGG